MSDNNFDKPSIGEIYRIVKEIRDELKEMRGDTMKMSVRIEALELAGTQRELRIGNVEREMCEISNRTWAIVLIVVSAIVGLALKFLLHL